MIELCEDYPSVDRVKARIEDLKVSIIYTNKTVRKHQNKKMMIRLELELKRAIWKCNNHRVFTIIEKEIDRMIREAIIGSFENFAEVNHE